MSTAGYEFDFVTPRLATGGAPADQGFIEALINAGVTHILDATAQNDDTSLLATHPQIVYLYNPAEDDGQPKPVDWFARSLTFGLPAFAVPHAKVYAHCSAGVNRGPSSAYVLMRALGWTGAEALALIKAHRPVAQVHYAPDADRAITALGFE